MDKGKEELQFEITRLEMKLGEYKERCRELQEKNLRLEMEKKAAEENLADIHMSLKKQLVEQESEIGELLNTIPEDKRSNLHVGTTRLLATSPGSDPNASTASVESPS